MTDKGSFAYRTGLVCLAYFSARIDILQGKTREYKNLTFEKEWGGRGARFNYFPYGRYRAVGIDLQKVGARARIWGRVVAPQ